jgi:hypothetical protein
MPIEIKELHIHIVVNSNTAKLSSVPTGRDSSVEEKEKNDLIAEFTERVFYIIHNQKER